jgi:ketosteroid isomerase-like protein
MSAENVAVVRRVYENFGRGDVPAVLAVLDPEVEWVESPQAFLPFAGIHRGPEQVVSGVFAPVMEHFEQFAVVPERFHDAGDVGQAAACAGQVRPTTRTGAGRWLPRRTPRSARAARAAGPGRRTGRCGRGWP